MTRDEQTLSNEAELRDSFLHYPAPFVDSRTIIGQKVQRRLHHYAYEPPWVAIYFEG
jgi:hypothetical protein